MKLPSLSIFFASIALAVSAPTTPAVAQSGPPLKMSKNMICHPKGGTYYNQTKNYRPFKRMSDCIRAGGRPPKR